MKLVYIEHDGKEHRVDAARENPLPPKAENETVMIEALDGLVVRRPAGQF